MSSAAVTNDPTQQSAASQAHPTASRKKGNKKKKASKPRPVDPSQQDDRRINEDLSDDDAPAVKSPVPAPDEDADEPSSQPEAPAKRDGRANGHAQAGGSANGHKKPQAPPQPANTKAQPPQPPTPTTTSDGGDDAGAKFDAMTQERDALRAEVEQLRQELETIRESHSTETAQLRSELEESEAARDRAEDQYQNLLGRVEKIKTTLGDRLKRDKEELAEAKDRVEELESQSDALTRRAEEAEAEAERLREEVQDQGRELASLRSRSNLSQQNWLKEKDDMARQLASYKAELDRTSSAMGEWEVIAMEQKSVRDSLGDKAAELEAECDSLREERDRAAEERDSQARVIDQLQRALAELQEARRRELREVVEASESQLEDAKKAAREAEANAAAAVAERARLAGELERTAPFEKEVKEKNLLIGKLRHEAIVLNDHLTKALKYIKKNKPEENVDRQVVTNLFLQFLSLDRSDPKKFQVLQVIAGMLNWSEEQKERAGLARPGTSSSSLRLPASPFHRTPSTPSLNTEFFAESTSGQNSKESLADLWAGFLERSVEEAAVSGAIAGMSSRKGSMSSNATGTTRPDTRGGA
ncbi:hypothetical protein RB595_004677 [Gaeumannomyces hyphopodioides]